MKISISTLRMHSKCTYMTLEIWCRLISSTWLRLAVDTSQSVCISQTGNRLWTTSSNTKFLVNITPQLSKGIISKLYNLLLQNLWSRHRSSFHTYLFFLSYVWPSKSSFGHYLSLSMWRVKVLLYLHFRNMSSYSSKLLAAIQQSFMGAPPRTSRMLTTSNICLLLLCVYTVENSTFSNPRGQFVIFKPLTYCFKETIGFDVKASFASRPESRLIRWYNEPGDITKKFW